MCLTLASGIYAYGGDTVLRATAKTVHVLRHNKEIAKFDIDVPIQWIKVSPNGKSALIYGTRVGTSTTILWRWREHGGLDLVVTAAEIRDSIGHGFIMVDGSVLTVLSQGGMLRAMSDDGREQFAANLRSPHSLHAYNFVNLPKDRIAIVGLFFADYCDTIMTVDQNMLLSDPEAVQMAVATKAPVWDRAVHLSVGPCEPNAAVVLRNPENDEVPQNEADLEDLGDVGNFAGVYIRDLDTGALIERHTYSGRTGMPIVANADWIAVQVTGGIDMIDRKSGAVHQVPAAILDVASLRIARIRDGDATEIVPLANLAPNH